MHRSSIGPPAGRTHNHAAMRWRIALAFMLVLPFAATTSMHAQAGFIGQVKLFSGNFAPRGWHDCDGSLLPIAQHQALFSLIGTIYGGDGQTTFALPDLRGRAVVGAGQGPGLSPYTLGQSSGVESVTLTSSQIPAHSHALQAAATLGATASPAGAVPAASPDGVGAYAATPDATMHAAAFENAGGTQPHPNMKPFLAIRYIICLEGIYPPRN